MQYLRLRTWRRDGSQIDTVGVRAFLYQRTGRFIRDRCFVPSYDLLNGTIVPPER